MLCLLARHTASLPRHYRSYGGYSLLRLLTLPSYAAGLWQLFTPSGLGQRVAAAAAAVSAIAAMACFSKVSDVITSPGGRGQIFSMNSACCSSLRDAKRLPLLPLLRHSIATEALYRY